MTTLAQARAEVITALTTAGVRATSTPGNDPPYVLVQGAGIDMGHITRSEALSDWRLMCVAGASDSTQSAASLDTLKLAVIQTLRALAGWRLGNVGRDGIRTYGGGEYLTAECSASRMIDL
jgi:hypothetical protein